MFVYLMEDLKPLNKEVVIDHVEHLKALKRSGKLVLCGPFTDYPGGMVVITAGDFGEATKIAEADPFIALGYKSFVMRTLEEANEENVYLLTV